MTRGVEKGVEKGVEIANRVMGLLDNRPIEVLGIEEVERTPKQDKKTVLFVGIRYDYGHKDWGFSYEYHNFYNTLTQMDFSLIYFDYDRLKQRYGIEKTSRILLETVYYYKPEMVFYFHYLDWILGQVWKEISTISTTIIWLSDDHWRFEETRPTWSLFDLVVTTDKRGYEKRKVEGFENVILSQWGCNHFLYGDLKLKRIFDVTFVGRAHGKRIEFIKTLEEKGVKVNTFGQDWSDGQRLSQTDLIKILNQSKISLNISFSSTGTDLMQIKGRDFEIPCCGSLLLTGEAEGISDFFVPGEEIITYKDADDAAEKIRYLLKNQVILERIAQRGRLRVLKDHTIEKRLLEIFKLASTYTNRKN
jgi:spore maturation protein CgeB